MRNPKIIFVVLVLAVMFCAAGEAREVNAALLPPDRPDLRFTSDSGFQSSDNYTNSTAPVFDIPGVAIGATVELLRDGVPVAGTGGPATSAIVTLIDPSPPSNAQVAYLSRQTLGAETATTPFALLVTYDNTRPTVTVNQGTQQEDPTPQLPVVFRLTVSEFIVGLSTSSLDFAGSTVNTDANSINVQSPSGSGSDLGFGVSGISLPGLVKVVIKENGLRDRAGNACFPSTSTDNEVTYAPVPTTLKFSGRIRRYEGIVPRPADAYIIDTATGETFKVALNPSGFFMQKNIPFYHDVVRRFVLSIRHKGVEIYRENTDVSQTFWNMDRFY